MGELLPSRRAGTELSRDERKLARALDRLHARTMVDVAEVRRAEAVEIAKVQAIAAVSTVALLEVSNVAMAEALCAERTPHAAGRLRYVADTSASAMAQVVHDLHRGLR